jgi:hypothetical protein
MFMMIIMSMDNYLYNASSGGGTYRTKEHFEADRAGAYSRNVG